jgi:hypothetical protein
MFSIIWRICSIIWRMCCITWRMYSIVQCMCIYIVQNSSNDQDDTEMVIEEGSKSGDLVFDNPSFDKGGTASQSGRKSGK